MSRIYARNTANRSGIGSKHLSSPKRILLIVAGGIAAYKSLDLVRRLQDRGHRVRVVMTKAATAFVTPLSFSALTNDRVFTDLFDLDDEQEIGHIRLARDHDVIVVAPATADLIARMAGGHADDLATAILLATDKPILVAPAMNPHMWRHPATRRNVAQLQRDGVSFVGPANGEMAERGEAGPGRLIDVPDLVAAIEDILNAYPSAAQSLAGRHVIVTSGPTHEPIDPVRYLANRSSGKQGHELAAAAAQLGARVTLISGPVALADPPGTNVVRVTEAAEMLRAVEAALPADIAIFAAAVADWRIASPSPDKIKKSAGGSPPAFTLAENADILKTIAHLKTGRPALVIGFAAETTDVLAHAKRKMKSKGADWIVANDVSPQTGIMGGDRNTVNVLSSTGIESWPDMSKTDVARRIIAKAADFLTAKRAAAE